MFDKIPNKGCVFEPYTVFIHDNFLKDYGKEIRLDGNVYLMSDLNYEIPRENIFQGLVNKRKAGEKIAVFVLNHRRKMIETESFGSSNE